MDNNNFGIFIMNIRKEKKMTQRQLADKLYITDKNGYEVRLTVEEVADLVNYLKIHMRGGL